MKTLVQKNETPTTGHDARTLFLNTPSAKHTDRSQNEVKSMDHSKENPRERINNNGEIRLQGKCQAAGHSPLLLYLSNGWEAISKCMPIQVIPSFKKLLYLSEVQNKVSR